MPRTALAVSMLALCAGWAITPIATGQATKSGGAYAARGPGPGAAGAGARFGGARPSAPSAPSAGRPSGTLATGSAVAGMRSGPSRPVAVQPSSRGFGLTRPLPLNFGGVRAKLPGPIGSAGAPKTVTNRPGFVGGGGTRPIVAPGTVAVLRDGGGFGSQVVTGGDGFSGHIGTSGVDLGYSTRGDNFSFSTSINNSSNVAVLNTGIWLTPGVHSIGRQWGCYGPYYGGYGYGYGGYDYGYPIYSPTWPYPDPYLSMYYTGSSTGVQPDPQPPAATPPTVMEQAEALLGAKQFEGAAAAYREQLAAHPDDAEALRMLGVTLMLDRKPREAGEYMLSAYRMSPSLATNPVILPIGLTDEDLAKAANRAIEHAQRTRTAPAWLAAAVLSQARDKLPVARNFAKAAKTAGLDPEVFARLMSAWNS